MPAGEQLLTPVAHALQLSLGAVFLAAAVPKWRAPRAFARTVAEYRLGPAAFSPFLARGLMVAEALLAAALLAGLLVWLAAPLALALLLVFTAAVGINLRRRRRIPCGCFGAGGETISGRSLLRLALLLAAAAGASLLVDVLRTPPISLTPLGSGRWPAADEVVAAGVLCLSLLLIGAWVLHLPELRSVVGHQRKEAA
jgi:Methylamine utilisation protein MauE